MRMKNPVHPGAVVREECLAPLGLTVTAAAAHLGVARQTLNNLVNEKSAMSPEMAIRLAKAFGSSAEVWMGLQLDHDVARAARLEPSIRVKPYRVPAPARREKSAPAASKAKPVAPPASKKPAARRPR